ncbi:MAG: ATP-NAD kinase family protein [Pseudomonadales bacterium]|jgi:predicted polyphosphate/ATP-dependent NAD kinase
MAVLELGLLVNPIAGVGGSVALKGSDGTVIQEQALARGGRARAPERTLRMLRAFTHAQDVHWLTWGGNMGAAYLDELEIPCTVLGAPGSVTSSADTRTAARAMRDAGVDLLVFAGGDGTARDLLEVLGEGLPVLGIPAGVKMHSGVFATTPEAAAGLLDRLLEGGLVSAVSREVRDLDESALRRGEIRPRYFGELNVPEPGGYLQHTKERGVESEALAVTEIVAELVEQLAETAEPVVLGPGGTLAEIKRALGCEPTVLGFDVWQAGRVLARDVDATWLLEHLDRAIVVLSFTRGQGFLLGRGNQQLTPAFLRRVGRDAIRVVGTRTKLKSLDGRPLLIDTDDPALDRDWSGLIEVITGYQDRLYYRLSDRA